MTVGTEERNRAGWDEWHRHLGRRGVQGQLVCISYYITATADRFFWGTIHLLCMQKEGTIKGWRR